MIKRGSIIALIIIVMMQIGLLYNNNSISNNFTQKTLEQASQMSTLDVDNNIAKIRNNNKPLGDAGRLFFSSIDFNVALYNADLYKKGDSQRIVDNIDSASYSYLNDIIIIADHDFQGFKDIIQNNIGDYAYIKKSENTISRFQMTEKLIGLNLGYDLTDLNGNSILNKKNILIIYTCYSTDKDNSVLITLWQEK